MRTITFSLLILFSAIVGAFAQINLTPAASFLGTHGYERVGYHLHTAGDVNGDGNDDFLIGAFHHGSNGYNCGAAYLILGRRLPNWGQNVALTNSDARFLGATAYESAGYFVGGGGDVNGDGLSDMVIGASSGCLYVVLGRRSANWGRDFVLYDQADASFVEEVQGDDAGTSCAIIGDLNGDGYDDIICGAPFSNYATDWGGKAYIILGKASGWQRGVSLANANASFYGSSGNGLVGYCVDGVGDVNGDGIPDFAIGARGDGKVYLFFGRRNVNWGKNYDINLADVIFTNEQYGNYTSWRVSGVGDVNRDSFDDFIISAPYHDEDTREDGKVYLILGRSSGWKRNLSEADASYYGEGYDDEAGWDAQGAGDVDGDGYADFLIGAWYNDGNGADTGKMYVIRGKPSGWQRNVQLSAILDYIVGENAGDYMGFSCACAGDVNGDGAPDLIASATYYSNAYYWGGKIYLILNEPPNPPGYRISGSINYFNQSRPIANASIDLTHIEGSEQAASDVTGAYHFDDIKAGSASLVLSKQNDIQDAIMGSDALLILRYLAFLTELTSDQIIAADVTGDGNVSGSDAQAMLRYLAFYATNIGATGQWRFNPSDTSFNLAANATINFKSYLLGDVNGSWEPGSSSLNMAKAAGNCPADLILSDKIEVDENSIQIPLKVVQVQSQVQTLVFSLSYDPHILEFQSARQTALSTDFLMAANADKPGCLHVAMAGLEGITNEGTMLTLIFKRKHQKPFINVTTVEISRAILNDVKLDANINHRANIRETDDLALSTPIRLVANHPNPFNPTTTIAFNLTDAAWTTIAVYNTLGQQVAQLFDGELASGKQEFSWNARDANGQVLPSGIYFFQIQVHSRDPKFAEPITVTQKMILIQ